MATYHITYQIELVIPVEATALYEAVSIISDMDDAEKYAMAEKITQEIVQVSRD